jgi:hypothetical protein
MITIEDIYDIALDDPIVYAAMMQYRRGDVTLEQALMGCVSLLHKKSKEMQAMAQYAVENSVVPVNLGNMRKARKDGGK